MLPCLLAQQVVKLVELSGGGVHIFGGSGEVHFVHRAIE